MLRSTSKRSSLLITIGLAISITPLAAQTNSKGAINWETFDTSSTLAKTEIRSENIQGLWNAYKGAYQFGEIVSGMNLTQPMIIEVKGNTCRRNSERSFEKFSLLDNLIISTTGSQNDTGIINKITPTELTISWKSKSNYTRYYYKK